MSNQKANVPILGKFEKIPIEKIVEDTLDHSIEIKETSPFTGDLTKFEHGYFVE